jgi:hypothetical protein
LSHSAFIPITHRIVGITAPSVMPGVPRRTRKMLCNGRTLPHLAAETPPVAATRPPHQTERLRCRELAKAAGAAHCSPETQPPSRMRLHSCLACQLPAESEAEMCSIPRHQHVPAPALRTTRPLSGLEVPSPHNMYRTDAYKFYLQMSPVFVVLAGNGDQADSASGDGARSRYVLPNSR